jgi:hypothetical protein
MGWVAMEPWVLPAVTSNGLRRTVSFVAAFVGAGAGECAETMRADGRKEAMNRRGRAAERRVFMGGGVRRRQGTSAQASSDASRRGIGKGAIT